MKICYVIVVYFEQLTKVMSFSTITPCAKFSISGRCEVCPAQQGPQGPQGPIGPAGFDGADPIDLTPTFAMAADPIGTDSSTTVIDNWSNEILDVGSNFDAVNGTYTVPSSGYYEFDVMINYRINGDPSFLANTPTIALRVNGVVVIGTPFPVDPAGTAVLLRASPTINYLDNLTAGDVVDVQLTYQGFTAAPSVSYLGGSTFRAKRIA